MPIQAPQWTEFLSCPVCCNEFDIALRSPISLGCGHTICKACLSNLHRKQCPFDQTTISTDITNLPVNYALLQLVGATIPNDLDESELKIIPQEHCQKYLQSKKWIEELALYLKPFSNGNVGGNGSLLSRPMQRKLVTLINCQLVEEEGRNRAMRAARSLGERTVTELILQHQNPQQLSANLWAAVRARGCQFLGPAMQEEVLKLVLLALEDGSALSRKVLVMFVVQRLEPHFPQASKTSIGHVVQLLYRASCFKVSKREGDSSLMQLKEEFRTYEALRREHDAQIVQIATEAGLRIAPDQWSALLYGDTAHKSHMQSIIDKLQTPQSFAQSVQELVLALQRTADPGKLSVLRPYLELLAGIDPSTESTAPSWEDCSSALEAVKIVVAGLVDFIQHHGSRKVPDTGHTHNTKYKISMCRDLTLRGHCPRGPNCTFAHSEEELEKYRAKNRKLMVRHNNIGGVRESRGIVDSQTADTPYVPPEDILYNTSPQSIPTGNLPQTTPIQLSRIGYDCPPPFHGGTPFPNTPTPTFQTSPPQPQIFSPNHPPPSGTTFTGGATDIYNTQTPHNIVLNTAYPPPQTPHEFNSPPNQRPEISLPKRPNWEQYVHGVQKPLPQLIQKRPAKSLMVLQQRRQEIITQLEKVVGKNAATAISHSATNQARVLPTPTDTENSFSIWTSNNSLGPTFVRSDSILMDDEYVPFEAPCVSKYGPISRMNKSPGHSVQVSSPFGENTISTSMTRRPVPAPSPVSNWYLTNAANQNMQTIAPPTAGLGDGYITIGHGICDPPQLYIKCQSQELLAESQRVKQQIRSLERKINDLRLATRSQSGLSEGERLAQELQYIEQGIIVEKEKEARLGQFVGPGGDNGSPDEDTYEASIAHDMCELELRWKTELEEQEKRWSSEDDTVNK
ncbi:roquin-1 [Chrysoperla carnea]|uniref:roquin-1 n=1 Tax=Chrysoperla carnea TaxID=189513 RepID=UPI001D0842E5|nr:roquin-1 [Chrysoperla carnea]